ncbi:hypothetical protein E4U43_008028 [Claviceps pusilla]|uniref:GPI anchored protein n=1 Tax=Claviceps pusilla TaxID=123648 RepID=A0A9P7SYL5_9HYPO|nr:hypothetical protein E4U43_008028 [Claviceps pusilla]
MAPKHTMVVPFLLVSQVVVAAAGNQPFPIAIKRQSPNSNNKILAEHLAFAPLLLDPPSDDAATKNQFLSPYAQHHDECQEGVLRRAAQALDLLRKRTSCPGGMNSCSDSGSPNKCCPLGTYCTSVPDTDVGHVACCPNGSICGGGIGKCPADAASCAPALGGGCCIPGYVCQGVGCVPVASATPTVVIPTTWPRETTTKTTSEAATQTNTQVIVPTKTRIDTAAGNPPWRPTGSSDVTTPAAPEITPGLTQTGCPTGFYGCLAIQGGGCCRNDQDCHSCLSPPLTTLISHGVTIVVPVPITPTTSVTNSGTCASGWFLCGKDDGAAPGCCPSGYECGTASCFTTAATATSKIPKQAPDQSSATKSARIYSLTWCLAALAFLL